MAMIRSSIERYFGYCVAATAAVVALPLLIVIGVAMSVRTGTPMLVALAVGGGFSLAAAITGSYLWRRRPESMDLCFGELMIWSFVRRRRAEQHIEEGAEVLGLDQGGKPLRRMPMTKEQRLKILHDLAVALETKDPYTHGHSTRVEELVAQTAAGLNLSDDELAELRTAASLHDVGKIRVPNRILRKPDRLTIDEQLIVQEHSAVGAWMVAGVSNGKIVSSVRHHHERWDGNGYPDGLAGKDIPLFARIIAVADAYDAMTSTRPYRPSMSRNQALAEIERASGEQFDPEIVEAFLQTVPRRVPLAALVGLGFAARFFRKTAAWAARTGSSTVAPGVASVGAASVVIASLFAPPAALTRPTPEAGDGTIVAGEPDEVADGLAVSADLKHRDRDAKVDDKRDAKDVKGVKDGKDRNGDRAGKKDSAGKDNGKRRDPNEVLGSVVRRPRRNGAPPSDESNGAGGPDEETPPSDTPSNPPSDPPNDTPRTTPEHPDQAKNDEPPPVHTDPQPEKGRDCPEEHPGQGQGGGTALHCG
ncbi:MAG: HD domain-containing protein [Actinomycetota bacterium]|nr:HD domain-containing protein [Actinomycetota bacterium]